MCIRPVSSESYTDRYYLNKGLIDLLPDSEAFRSDLDLVLAKYVPGLYKGDIEWRF